MRFIDLHTHPNYKPFAWAHKQGQPFQMGLTSTDRSSLWYYDPPSLFDKAAQYILSVTKFSQSNGTAAYYGNVGIMSVALGSVEQPFFKNKLGIAYVTDLLDNFAAGFGHPRINTIETMTDYWNDMQKEIAFMESGEGKVVKVDNMYHTYALVNSFDQMRIYQEQNEHPDAGKKKDRPIVLCLFFTVEGMHVLNTTIGSAPDRETVLQNVRHLKNMKNPPWFANFSHHFFNYLCGHARSLREIIGKITDQETGINEGFTPLGKEVLELLLNKDEGRRIYIDIKHLSKEGRKYYRAWRKQHAPDVPLVISHGVCNGLPHYDAEVSNHPMLGNGFINPAEDVRGGDGTFKEHNSINFYDEEIIDLVLSNGIMGIQLDERRLANETTIKRVRHSPWRNKIMHYRSELLWNQLLYMAEMLDAQGMFGWGHVAIGSDYDGIVDPLNSFWTLEQYEALQQFVERHAYKHFTEKPDFFRHSFNRITADEVVERLFHRNAWEFFKRWF